jgi:hypothetical protein
VRERKLSSDQYKAVSFSGKRGKAKQAALRSPIEKGEEKADKRVIG